MAERTGDEKIDALIKEFISIPISRNSWDYNAENNIWEERGKQIIQVDSLRDPEIASGQCGKVSLAFINFLLERGIEASDSSLGPFLSPESFGYEDRTRKGDSGHIVPLVHLEEGMMMIDFSASQYGYSEFPMVQRFNEEGKWQREPDGVNWNIPEIPVLQSIEELTTVSLHQKNKDLEISVSD